MPKITQISVSLENKPGALARLCSALGKEGVNLSAVFVPEATGRGRVRLVVDKTTQARDVLKAHKIRFSEEDAMALVLDNRPGALAEVAEKLADARINIRYAYATTPPEPGRATIIIAVPNVEKALDVLGG